MVSLPITILGLGRGPRDEQPRQRYATLRPFHFLLPEVFPYENIDLEHDTAGRKLQVDASPPSSPCKVFLGFTRMAQCRQFAEREATVRIESA